MDARASVIVLIALSSVESAVWEPVAVVKSTVETPAPAVAPTEEIQEPKTEDKSKVQKALDSIKNLFSKN